MNKFAFVAVPVGILIAAACAVPWYVGMQTEEAMRGEARTLAGSAQFPFNVAYTRYERGWFSSNAVSRVTLKAEPNVYLDLRHDISHLPDPQAGWVRVHTVPEWTGPAKDMLAFYFGAQPALTVDTVIGFDGSRRTEFRSPPFSKQGPGPVKVNWGGMQGLVMVGADERMIATATIPSLGGEGGDTQVGLNTLKFDANWDVRGPMADWQGETKLAVAEMHFSGPGGSGTLKDLSGAAYQRIKGDNVLLGYLLRVGAVRSAKAGEAEQTFSNAVLDLEFDQINRKALAKYVNDIGNVENLAAGAGARNQPAAQIMLELASELLRGSPVIRLKQLAVETPSGSMLAQATISFDGTNLKEIQFSPELLSRLKAKGNLEIGSALLRSQLQRKVRPQVEVALLQQGAQSTEENIKALSEKMTEDQLKSLTDSGILRLDGDKFSVEAEFTAGQVLVNGQPSPLFGGAMMPPASREPAQKPAQPEMRAAAPERADAVARSDRQAPLTPALAEAPAPVQRARAQILNPEGRQLR